MVLIINIKDHKTVVTLYKAQKMLLKHPSCIVWSLLFKTKNFNVWTTELNQYWSQDITWKCCAPPPPVPVLSSSSLPQPYWETNWYLCMSGLITDNGIIQSFNLFLWNGMCLRRMGEGTARWTFKSVWGIQLSSG